MCFDDRRNFFNAATVLTTNGRYGPALLQPSVVMGGRTSETGSGIVSFRKPGFDAKELVRRLREARISAAPRAGWVRTSPHFYISPDDIDQMLEVLP